MQGVAPRSSVVQSHAPTHLVFDIATQDDVIKLLNAIRRSTLGAGDKNLLRDLVLDYAVAQNEVILEDIAARLTNSGIAVSLEGKIVGQKTEQKQALGASRPTPIFQPRRVNGGEVVPQEAPAESTPTNSHIVSNTPKAPVRERTVRVQSATLEEVAMTPAETTKPSMVQDPVSTQVPQTPSPEPSVQQEEKKLPVQSETPVSDVLPETPQHTPVAEAPQSTPEQAPIGDPHERIKEIKRLVNQKVGNPVNLIDANNEVGREYMNSLLHAMKLLNGGSRDEVMLAMDRLEKAYRRIEETIQSGETIIGVKDKKEEPSAPTEAPATPESKPSPKAEVHEPVAPEESKVEEEMPKDVSPVAEPVQSTTKEKLENAAMSPRTDDTQPDKETSVVESEHTKVTIPTDAKTEKDKKEESSSGFATHEGGAGTSLADQLRAEIKEREETLEKNANRIERQVTREQTDPLHADPINAGLHQLLSEWKLFKSSGIFGTGPSGQEHPLYRTLAGLPMAAVIAGRYEGANPQIKQSISDYMNGWRYEQGIIHEMGETFEHYLRRVIKAIIDRQNAQKKQS